ncbi:2'-deoxycytidine 5'-triphosphate deaminase [Zavarzinia sp. CC-PAN008]|uniref:2'-deoxycytidine 5'-triphosphate deaminase n=1 Tax=Zavarzinia sp. CC-PAN008 TaxID=3243332 RepID=UPI003F747E50
MAGGQEPTTWTGLAPSQTIKALIAEGRITALLPIEAQQIQPSSLDLRLGTHAYRVRASFLPGQGATVWDKVQQLGMHEIDLRQGAVLERGCVYIVPLVEEVHLPGGVTGIANPKSTTGRLDVFTRLITDRSTAFDRVEPGYSGLLYAEIAPRTFSIVARAGATLSQMRFRMGSGDVRGGALRDLHARIGLVHQDGVPGTIRDDALGVSLDLSGRSAGGLVGFRAKRHAALIDLERIGHYDPLDFWEPIMAPLKHGLVLDPDEFYILVTKEDIRVPPAYAAEMIAYDTMMGEFRVHYAGFFDPGFGFEPGGPGSKAVLEVRSHEVPFLLEDGQLIGSLRFERLTAEPTKVYGPAIGSSYQRQALALSKQFRPFRI